MLPNIYLNLLAVDGPGSSPWPIILTALVAAVMGMGVVKLIGYLRKQDAEKEARQIIEKAEIQASGLGCRVSARWACRDVSFTRSPSRSTELPRSVMTTPRFSSPARGSGLAAIARLALRAAGLPWL